MVLGGLTAVVLMLSAHVAAKSCNELADKTWADTLGLQTCPTPNTRSLLEVVGNSSELQRLADQFDIEPMSAQQASCLMNNPKHPSTTANLKACVPLIAPPANSSAEERRLASLGLMHEPGDSKLVSLCKPSMPCKEFNEFLANGSLAASALNCGALSALEKAFVSMDMLRTIALGFEFQNSDTGKTDNCFCTRKDGLGLRGPVFGPIFYVNAKLIYLIGGLEALGRMPGCRVLCPTAVGNGTLCQPPPLVSP